MLEFLPGGTLEERLPELDEREAHAVAADVAAALAYAHSQGVVHGSLNLSNVFFDGEGRAKVAGFGGSGTPEEDTRALDSILATLAQAAPAAEEETAVIAPPPRRRRTGVLAAAAALTLLVAGVGAAFLATGDSTTDVPTGSLSVPVPSQTTFEETEAPPPTDTAETTTTATTATEPQPTTAPTTAPPPTVTLPPPLPTTIEPPPTTTEELPPTTTEATPPPTEPEG